MISYKYFMYIGTCINVKKKIYIYIYIYIYTNEINYIYIIMDVI